MNTSLLLKTACLVGALAALAAGNNTPGPEAAAAARAPVLRDDQRLWNASYEAEQQGQYDQALKPMKTIRESHGDFYLANLRTGWLLYLKKDYAGALAAYQKASLLAPGALSPLIGQMNCHDALGDGEGSLRAGMAVLVLDPMNASVNRRLADLHYARKDYARAASYYLKLATLFPEDLDLANALAWSYLNSSRPAEAQAIFEAILVVAPAHASALQGLAICTSPAPAATTPRKE